MECFRRLRTGPGLQQPGRPDHRPFSRSSVPGAPAKVPGCASLHELHPGILEDALRALPVRFELSTSAGVVFSNRHDSGRGSVHGTVVSLSGGISMTYWDNNESPSCPRAIADEMHMAHDASALATATADAIDLELFPVPAWVTKVTAGAPHTSRINSRWAAFFGLPPGEIPLAVWHGALHDDDRERLKSAWQSAISSGSEYSSEGRLRHAHDGEYLWFRSQARPLRDANGAVVAYIGVT